MLHNFSRELEIPDRLETNYLRLLYYEFPQKYSGSYRSYEYARLCTILEGEKKISVNGKESCRYNQDMFLLMPPESDVTMTIDMPTRALVLELSDELIRKVSDNLCSHGLIETGRLAEEDLLCTQFSLDMKHVVEKIGGVLATRSRETEYILDLYAQELVYDLFRINGSRHILDFEPSDPVNKAIQFMQREYRNSPSIRQLAHDLGMSDSSFCQYFKRITGVAPKEYLTSIKLEKAAELLAQESVTDVAFDLGYESISNFIGAFRRKYGVTPKQYKKGHESSVVLHKK